MVSRHEITALMYRTDFRSYLDFCFRQLHQGQTLRPLWSVDLMADRVEAVARGDLKRLIINAPPRSLKSFIATIALASFVLGRGDPSRRILLIFGHQSLASEMMMRLGRLMGSARYRSIFPDVRLQITATAISTQHGGGIRSTIVGQQLSGHGADLIIIDDPLSPSHAAYEASRTAVNSWYDKEVMQRFNSKANGRLVLVMQRVSSGDLSSHLSDNDGFESVVLPSVATSDEDWQLSNGRRLIRKRGEVLDPDEDSADEQLHLMGKIGAYAYATQYLQNTCGSDVSSSKMLFAPKPPDWSSESGFMASITARLSYRDVVMHRAFGHPLSQYHGWSTQSPFTLEEFEARAIIQQRELVALAQGDM